MRVLCLVFGIVLPNGRTQDLFLQRSSLTYDHSTFDTSRPYQPPTPEGPIKPYLALEGTAGMPKELLGKGNAVIDDVTHAVLNAFPGKGSESPLEADNGEYTKMMSSDFFDLSAIESKLDHMEYKTVKSFVEGAASAAKKNPILVEFAARWSELSAADQAASYPPPSSERNEDVRRAVILAYVEDRVAKAAMLEEKKADGGILAYMVRSFMAKRASMTHGGVPEWRRFFDAFEELKRVSVDAGIDSTLTYKKDSPASDELFNKGFHKLVTFHLDGRIKAFPEINNGILLSVNILEAMYEDMRRVWQQINHKTVPVDAPICNDTLTNTPTSCKCLGGDPMKSTQCGPPSSGSNDNAEAALALVMHSSKVLVPGSNRFRACQFGPKSQQACSGMVWAIPSTVAAVPRNISAELHINGKATGSFKISSPFPVAWNNLYNSWNAAFVSGYVDSPLFYAKLFNPLVAGYYQENDAAMYMWPRAVTLYMMVQQTILRRVEMKRNLMTNVQWNRPVLTQLWGKVNNEAAYAYRARLQKAWDDTPVGWTHNPVYDALKLAIEANCKWQYDVVAKGWHWLAGRIAQGATISDETIATITSIASALTGLGSMN